MSKTLNQHTTGKFLSLEELSNQIAPHPKVVQRIDRYLHDIGATEIAWTAAKEFVQFHISVERAQKAFQTTFFRYFHKVSQRSIVRAAAASADEIYLPDEVGKSIDLTLGLLDFFGLLFFCTYCNYYRVILFYIFILIHIYYSLIIMHLLL